MGLSAAVLRVPEIDEQQWRAWDELCGSRGSYADIYATAAWFRAWAAAAPGEVARTRLVTVLEGDRPLAVLPLTEGRFGAWRGAGAFRYRTGPVLAGEQPDAGVLATLVEGVARAGARSLQLRRLPLRDPAVAALLTALGDAGFSVTMRPAGCDNVTPVRGGWDEHARRFRGFARYAHRMVGRVLPLWDVEMDTYGTTPGRPVEDGFAIYADIQARSWKGPFSPAVRAHRAALLGHAQGHGWARVFVLRIGGVPAAGHIWFRLGDVAVWLSTAYDARLAALSPGTVAQWWAQERMFADPPPRLVDLLPGANAQKDRLTLHRPPLVDLVAVRQRSFAVAPAVDRARRVAAAARARARAARASRSGADHVDPAPARPVRVAPDPARTGVAQPVVPDAALLRYLAVAGAHPSTEAMTERWAAGDEWVRTGAPPRALVRLGAAPAGGDRVIREVVHVAPGGVADDAADAVAADVAAALGEPLVIMSAAEDGPDRGTAVEEHTAPLPWPRALDELVGVGDRAAG